MLSSYLAIFFLRHVSCHYPLSHKKNSAIRREESRVLEEAEKNNSNSILIDAVKAARIEAT
jgi:hypothetical protein